MARVTITAVGADRPGIVAEFSGALYRLGANLEDTTMTRLGSQFAMILLVRLPEAASVETLETALAPSARDLGLSLVVRPVTGDEDDESTGNGYILRVHGADRAGIVHAVTALLSARGFNITDLNTRVLPGAGGPVYVLLLEVDVPSEAEASALAPELERLRRELKVEISLAPLEQEVL